MWREIALKPLRTGISTSAWNTPDSAVAGRRKGSQEVHRKSLPTAALFYTLASLGVRMARSV